MISRLLLPLVCVFGLLTQLSGQEKPGSSAKPAAAKTVKVKPSKVSAAKGREREKLFTEWMPQNTLVRLNDEKNKSGEQMIYFEYHEGKDQYRAIHSKAIDLRGWSWNTLHGEKDMEDQVSLNKSRGTEPAFVVLERNYYQMMFVQPEQLSDVQKILKDLGIEPPTVK
ncbi:MAG: hypothetical protein V4662_00575 [Verrucomicrobiota bacterium]